jgi:predicted NUDIX family phosphoesterase
VVTEREMVLGLARDAVPGGLDWRGVVERPFAPLLEAIATRGEFRPRDDVEDDPSFKQVIPYLVLRDGDRVFLMKRTKAGADERLHERYSIGVGGHVNPDDGGVAGGLVREWSEEIAADFTPDFVPVGLLNDDDNAVGAVHLGLVYAADAGGRPVAIRETHKLAGEFATFAAVAEVEEKLETWSALLFDFLRQR